MISPPQGVWSGDGRERPLIGSPNMHYVPAVSLPQTLRTWHLERNGVKAGAEHASAVSPSDFAPTYFGALARRRRLHPRLRWPRLAHSGQRERVTEEGATDSATADGDVGAPVVPQPSPPPCASQKNANAKFKGRRGMMKLRCSFVEKAEDKPCVILPRRRCRTPVVSGTISTLHEADLVSEPDSQDDARLIKNTAKLPVKSLTQAFGKRGSLDRLRPDDSMRCLSTEPVVRTPAVPPMSARLSRSSRKAADDKKVEASKIDRKYLLRVAPISCLTSDTMAKAVRRGADSPINSDPNAYLGPSEVGEYLQFENWGLNDDYIESLMSAHCQSCGPGEQNIQHINLSHNQLTFAGLESILTRCSSESVLGLNLASNRLSEGTVPKGIAAITSCNNLQELDLSGNILSDRFVEQFSSVFRRGECRKLQGLSLERCGLGRRNRAGVALGSMVACGLMLTSLNLNWNMLHGEGALSFLKGVLDNGNVKGNLSKLNIGWNSLGSGSYGADETRREEGEANARVLADIFRSNTVLFHIDLSYNSFNADECGIMAKGLIANHSLYGLHMIGNAATVDGMGFVMPLHRDKNLRDSPISNSRTQCFVNAAKSPFVANLDQALPELEEAEEKKSREVELRGFRLGEALTGPELEKGDERQVDLNTLIHSVPRARQLDIPMSRSRENSAQRLLFSGDDGSRSPRSRTALLNPSLHGLDQDETVNVTEVDLQWERNYVADQSLVTGYTTDDISVQRNAHCCWICESWVEHRTIFKPSGALGEDGSRPDLERKIKIDTIKAFYSIDGFARPSDVLLRQTADSKMYVARRMLPYSWASVEVVFLVTPKSGAPFCVTSDDFPRKNLRWPRTLPVVSVVATEGDEAKPMEITRVNVISVVRMAMRNPSSLNDAECSTSTHVVPRSFDAPQG